MSTLLTTSLARKYDERALIGMWIMVFGVVVATGSAILDSLGFSGTVVWVAFGAGIGLAVFGVVQLITFTLLANREDTRRYRRLSGL